MAFNMFKKKCKQDYVLNIGYVQGLDVFEGKEVVLKWRRGKKDTNKGKFNSMKVLKGVALAGTDAVIKLHCTLFEKSTPGFYEEKLLQFIIENIEGKRIVSGVIDLAQHAGLDGSNRDIVIDLKGKGKVKKARLFIKISSTEGVVTGQSENTENLVLTDDDEMSISSGPGVDAVDPIHNALIQKMREKEEQEELELRQKQLKERDETKELNSQNVEVTVTNPVEKKEEIKLHSIYDEKQNNIPESKEPIKESKESQENNTERVQCQLESKEEIKTEEINKEEITNNIVVQPQNNRSITEKENITLTEKQQVEEFFKIKRNCKEIIEILKKCQEPINVNEVIKRYVEAITQNLVPLLNSCLFSKRSISEYTNSEVEQITSKIIMKSIKNNNEMMVEEGCSNEIIKRINKQIFHNLSYYVLDTLIQEPENICCSKGFQFKFFMTYMDMLSLDDEYKIFKEEYQQMNLITDIANVFMQHHCISVDEIYTLFPTLSNEIIYKLLSNFHTDDMDQEPVKSGFLESIQTKCSNEPIPTRYTFVAN
ncbi:hypothetical protein EHI8A_081010 [Entamoeba histolytica HM-1:IMSS-B]|nr:Hypothetical protein EHI5A_047080 [Entamoeba histolytica KU27]EMH76939.1 hypothetical protein EHI8A_081010 [Entamoeba histolytica HM-1:IMSS-B]EMS15191.1 hypothetical protein KM1_144340 [Entamoeba histolytica HM-3:IMSS]GAT92820.1 hypothetical protein CL6EHI_125760 [Entamoeba histolytica]